MEMIEIADYKIQLATDYPDEKFQRAVVKDLTRRRDEYCPDGQNSNSEFGIRNFHRNHDSLH